MVTPDITSWSHPTVSVPILKSPAGAENWAIIASIIETSKLSGIDPFACLTSTLTAIVSGHKQNQIAPAVGLPPQDDTCLKAPVRLKPPS
ncbi:transposase domain-containing protein [Rhizobium laguerreae]|uniref:transposase domain-containing protein n=1 Tax=Rhizobium laguerreae TaxID=1076926 RepID=UPI0037039D60